jgi:hypothetical protein
MLRMREQTFETDAFRSFLFIRGCPAQPAGVKGHGLLWIGPRPGSGLRRPGELLRPRALKGIPYSGVPLEDPFAETRRPDQLGGGTHPKGKPSNNVGGGYVWAL